MVPLEIELPEQRRRDLVELAMDAIEPPFDQRREGPSLDQFVTRARLGRPEVLGLGEHLVVRLSGEEIAVDEQPV
jgi:hypothetical protein